MKSFVLSYQTDTSTLEEELALSDSEIRAKWAVNRIYIICVSAPNEKEAVFFAEEIMKDYIRRSHQEAGRTLSQKYVSMTNMYHSFFQTDSNLFLSRKAEIDLLMNHMPKRKFFIEENRDTFSNFFGINEDTVAFEILNHSSNPIDAYLADKRVLTDLYLAGNNFDLTPKALTLR